MSCSSVVSPAELEAIADRCIRENEPLRIFGYASVVWDQGFPISGRKLGSVDKSKRRFYQGNVAHRGTKEMPGRVATLLPSKHHTVWGVVFEVVGAEAIRAAIDHLTEREIRLGGYCCVPLSFRPLNSKGEPPQEAFAFIALPDNPQYLGKASIEQQALQVAQAFGPRGSNADYVRGVADFMRAEVPDAEARDPYLFRLLECMETILAEFAADL